MNTVLQPQPNTLTVSQLNHLARELLGEVFHDIRVEGEISNLSTPSSGHIYFSLKDSNAQIRCAMFRARLSKLGFKPADGQQVIVRGQVSLYEPRGDYQLIVEDLEEAGAGLLRRNFERLKQLLATEGLFESKHKQAIPALPRSIGIITSPTGAAIRDILSVLQRRFPAIPAIIYPTIVQGETAKFGIVDALNLANQRAECDVLILSRGGGSLEDLWAFNEEIVARAVFASKIPIISGIGHEIDFSIADFVADLRAATPSAAAEHAVPDQQVWQQRFNRFEQNLQQSLRQKLLHLQQQLTWQSQRLQQQHPGQRLQQKAQTLDQLETRLHQNIKHCLARANSQLLTCSARLGQYSPAEKIRHYQTQQQYLAARLQSAIHTRLQQAQQRLARHSQTLHAVSPLATLERGYAIVRPISTLTVIQQSQQLQIGDLVETRFAQGRITSLVKEIFP